MQKLVKRARDVEVNVKSEILPKDKEKEDKKKNEAPKKAVVFHENIKVADLENFRDCTIIYSGISEDNYCKTNLNEELDEIIKLYNFVPDTRKMVYKRYQCTKLVFNKDGRNVTLQVDPNDQRPVNWKIVQKLCLDNNIEFKNQTLSSMVKEMRERFYGEKSVRHVFTEDERKTMHQECSNCVNCDKKLTLKQINIDHIMPLACGGDNSQDNLQILCKKCHFEKTKEEHENGYVKLSQTQSSFNQQTMDVFTSSLCNVNAFVETLLREIPTTMKAQKIYNFDINRCRKNMLYHSKSDFPLFTVMDQVVEYFGDHSRAGRYYIECEGAFPIRGNGWYYQPMIEYLISIGQLRRKH